MSRITSRTPSEGTICPYGFRASAEIALYAQLMISFRHSSPRTLSETRVGIAAASKRWASPGIVRIGSITSSPLP